MKYYLKFSPILLLIIGLLVLTCKNEELGRVGFPRVHTSFVEMISDTGALFRGEIMDIPDDCEVIDHGFIWSTAKGATMGAEKISLGRKSSIGEFQAFANRAMKEGVTYYFKAFAQTSKVTVFGNELSFVSLGSHAPVVTSVTPDRGSWNDTVYIHGKYFSNSQYQMQVYFDEFMAYNTTCLSDTLIKAVVPVSLDTTLSRVALRFMNVNYPSDIYFKLEPNVKITSIEPTSGPWNTVVKLRGKNFNVIQSAYFEDVVAGFKSRSDTLVEVKVPVNLNTAVSDVKLKLNSFTFLAPSKFSLVAGEILSLAPYSVSVGAEVKIRVQNIRTATAKVNVGGIDAIIKSRNDTLIIFTMPQINKSGSYSITITDEPFQITKDKAIYFKIPEITGFFPQDATWGDTLKIIGSNFDLYNNWNVTIGSVCPVVSVRENYIKVIIPSTLTAGVKQIDVFSGSFHVPCAFSYQLPTPVISYVETVNDAKDASYKYLLIYGKYLGCNSKYNTYVNIKETGQSLNFSYLSSSEIKCSLPGLLNGVYSVQINYENGFGTITKENCITINGPFSLYFSSENSAFSWGKIFKNDNNSFYISTGNSDFIFDFNNLNYNEVPKSLPTSGIFEVNNRDIVYLNYSDRSMKKTNLDSKLTTKLSDFAGGTSNYACGISCSGKNYFLGFDPNGFNSYRNLKEFIEPNIWNNISQLTLDYAPTCLFENNGSVFILNNMYNFWKYEPSQAKVTALARFPGGSYPKLISSIGSKIYFYTEGVPKPLFEYNIDTNSWLRVCSFLENINPDYFFTNNGKGYLVSISSGKLRIIEFDPAKIN